MASWLSGALGLTGTAGVVSSLLPPAVCGSLQPFLGPHVLVGQSSCWSWVQAGFWCHGIPFFSLVLWLQLQVILSLFLPWLVWCASWLFLPIFIDVGIQPSPFGCWWFLLDSACLSPRTSSLAAHSDWIHSWSWADGGACSPVSQTYRLRVHIKISKP